MKILSPKKYASEFNVGYQTVLHLCKTKQLKTVETMNGNYKIIVSDDSGEIKRNEKEDKTTEILTQIKANSDLITELTNKNVKLISELNKLI